MKTNEKTNDQKPDQFEREVFEALKRSGFDLIKSEQEVNDFVENVGNTQVELPESFANPTVVFQKLLKKVDSSTIPNDELALAARGQKGHTLSKGTIEKIKRDLSSGKKVKSKRRNGPGPKR